MILKEFLTSGKILIKVTRKSIDLLQPYDDCSLCSVYTLYRRKEDNYYNVNLQSHVQFIEKKLI